MRHLNPDCTNELQRQTRFARLMCWTLSLENIGPVCAADVSAFATAELVGSLAVVSSKSPSICNKHL